MGVGDGELYGFGELWTDGGLFKDNAVDCGNVGVADGVVVMYFDVHGGFDGGGDFIA